MAVKVMRWKKNGSRWWNFRSRKEASSREFSFAMFSIISVFFFFRIKIKDSSMNVTDKTKTMINHRMIEKKTTIV